MDEGGELLLALLMLGLLLVLLSGGAGGGGSGGGYVRRGPSRVTERPPAPRPIRRRRGASPSSDRQETTK